ncbi:S8 family peptidase [Seongchinamella unica]|uniref:S8 family peptidase n=1 Tax=Seongchinamella unica TaxID=2547392 RepID=A0A4R5LMW8_9GAMM|nr:S8 family peptidase [Seongchinamella unica]TDG11416.1 S8 family peptidase [Seongchinamella unica]
MQFNTHFFSRRIRLVASLALTAAMVVGGSGAGIASTDGKQASGPPALAGGKKSYIVLMESAPLVAYEGDISGLPATKPARGKKLDTNSKAAQKYQAHLLAKQEKLMSSAGISPSNVTNSYTAALNGFSAVMTEAQRLSLENTKGVSRVMEDAWRHLDTDASPTFIGLTEPASVWQTGVTGEGVIVGVIDSGIWPEHPSFADDGSYPDAPALDDSRPNCEFGNTTHNANDAPFECNNKLIGARQMIDTYRFFIGADPEEFDSARDDDGHGTHTASTAAGNAGVEASMFGIPRGTVSGIAPRAHIIAYKGLGTLGGFTSDLARAIDQAVADGVDVINYSIGGGASEPGVDDIAFLFAEAAGVHVATSAGNSGPGASTLGSPGVMPWMTTVGANTQTRFMQGTVVLGNGSEYAGASITQGLPAAPLVDAEFAGGDLCIPGTLDANIVAGKVVLCRRGAIARVGKSQAVAMAGGVGTILYNNSDEDNLSTDNHATPAVHIDQTPGLAIKDYIATTTEPTAAIIGEQSGEWNSAPSMAIFSSRGPNPILPDILKPDITSVGFQVLAGNSPFPIGGVPGELFQAIGGTSMSSPHVAGAFALIKQAHPDWTPAMARSAIMTTASQGVVDNDRTTPAGPFAMGAGHMELGNKGHKGSAFQPGLVYDAGFLDYLALMCGQDWGIVDPAFCDQLLSRGFYTEAANLNYPSITMASVVGTKTVVRTVTSVASEQGWRTYNASVDAPDGYEVTVNPSSIRLKPGQSASFEVTATNVSAPVGEWRVGSLTWSDSTGNYDVRSPLAVRGALFSAPPVVTGSGAEGSASIEVTFGYTGSYSAAPHGLVADAPTSDNIGQDPDQTYPSPDDSPVGVQKIDFPIAGAGFVRWQLAIPGDDDIDLFLENSGGNIIASSTNGGTDELIELFLPADDTYTMVVHGWSVPSESLPYTLHFWAVPLAPGGSLSVDAAPTSATLGATGTIDVSWSGLTTGSYMGAVSHTGDAGLMGLTLVEVQVD